MVAVAIVLVGIIGNGVPRRSAVQTVDEHHLRSVAAGGGRTALGMRDARAIGRLGQRVSGRRPSVHSGAIARGDLGIMALAGCVAIVVRIRDDPAGVDLLDNDVRADTHAGYMGLERGRVGGEVTEARTVRLAGRAMPSAGAETSPSRVRVRPADPPDSRRPTPDLPAGRSFSTGTGAPPSGARTATFVSPEAATATHDLAGPAQTTCLRPHPHRPAHPAQR